MASHLDTKKEGDQKKISLWGSESMLFKALEALRSGDPEHKSTLLLLATFVISSSDLDSGSLFLIFDFSSISMAPILILQAGNYSLSTMPTMMHIREIQ